MYIQYTERELLGLPGVLQSALMPDSQELTRALGVCAHLVDRGGLRWWGGCDICQVSALALSLCLSCLHLGSCPRACWDGSFCFLLRPLQFPDTQLRIAFVRGKSRAGKDLFSSPSLSLSEWCDAPERRCHLADWSLCFLDITRMQNHLHHLRQGMTGCRHDITVRLLALLGAHPCAAAEGGCCSITPDTACLERARILIHLQLPRLWIDRDQLQISGSMNACTFELHVRWSAPLLFTGAALPQVPSIQPPAKSFTAPASPLRLVTVGLQTGLANA